MKRAVPPSTGDALPHPTAGSRWRWAHSRRVMVGGGALAAVLSLGSAAAGASSPHSTKAATTSGHKGVRPASATQPAAAGKITALSGDVITIEDRQGTSQTVSYTSATTFHSRTGTASAANLKDGDFIAAQGTKDTDGSVVATNIMISTTAPGHRGHGPGGRPPAARGAMPKA